MKIRAKDLYHERFVPSDLAAKLDIVVNDLTQEPKAKSDEHSEKRPRTEAQIAAISSYPSPERSSTQSPEIIPLMTSADVDEGDTSLPLSILTRKRRSPSIDTPQVDQPNKRFR